MTFPNLFSPSSTASMPDCIFSGILPLFNSTGVMQNRLLEIFLVPLGTSKKVDNFFVTKTVCRNSSV